MNVHTGLTVACAAIYSSTRASLMRWSTLAAFGQFRARTLLFTIGWIAFFVYAVALLLRAM
jgi:hypothetical protein